MFSDLLISAVNLPSELKDFRILKTACRSSAFIDRWLWLIRLVQYATTSLYLRLGVDLRNSNDLIEDVVEGTGCSSTPLSVAVARCSGTISDDACDTFVSFSELVDALGIILVLVLAY